MPGLKFLPNHPNQFVDLLRAELVFERRHAVATFHYLSAKIRIRMTQRMSGSETRNFQRLAVFKFYWSAQAIHTMAVLAILREDAAHPSKRVGRRSRRSRRRSFRFGVSRTGQLVAARARYQRADDYHQDRSAETHSVSLSSFFLERGQYTTRLTA
jgi:hypothetical protein